MINPTMARQLVTERQRELLARAERARRNRTARRPVGPSRSPRHQAAAVSPSTERSSLLGSGLRAGLRLRASH